MSSTVDMYLNHLWDLGRTEIKKLIEDDYYALTCKIIKETPTKHLPLFEKYDDTREIMIMMADWIEGEDDYLGHEILCKMRDRIIKSMSPLIEDRMHNYSLREEKAAEQNNRNQELEGYAFDKQRI